MTSGRRRPAGEPQEKPDGTGLRSGGYVPRTQARATVVRGRGLRDGPGSAPSGRAGAVRFIVFVVGLAAVVLIGLVTIGAPIVGDAVYGFATSRPDSMRWPFVASIVKDHLGNDLTMPAGQDGTQVKFVVQPGATASDIGQQLQTAGLIHNQDAFVYLVVTQGAGAGIQSGTYRLAATMTPQQVLDTLKAAPIPTVTVALREGLRLEQITAYLQTLPLKMDVAQFYDLVSHPPATLLAEFPWLDIPQGRSLEGFLAPDTYSVWDDITPIDLVRLLVNNYHAQLGDDLLKRIADSGKGLYQVVTLASIVQKEVKLPEEEPIIAGVYQNRLDKKMLLNADPTVIYAKDSVELSKVGLKDWVAYYFWLPVQGALAAYNVPADLQGFQTYQTRGLPPGPICTPTADVVEAALAPDTSTGYLYFVAIPDGSGHHAFAKTLAEHEANLKKYGYAT